ncbi:MAG: hypothetical protein SOW80_08235 [Anaerovoracaceae bacterium]|nr:hypothetical protein [Anaerovoracaceae bacterium]
MLKKWNMIWITVLLAVAMVFFSACGGEKPASGNNGTGTEPPTAGTNDPETGTDSGEVDGLDLIGGSLSYVCEQNKLSKLLDFYENIYLVTRFTDGEEGQCVYFRFQGNNGWAAVDYSETNRQVLSGCIGPMYFYTETGVVTGLLNMEEYTANQPNEEPSFDQAIAAMINEDAQVEKVEDLGNYLKVTAGIETADGLLHDIYVLDKESLHLIEAFYMDADGMEMGGNSLEKNWDDNGLIANFLTAWEETRTVTFIYDKMLADGNTVTEKSNVEVPATWEVLPQYPEETFYYMNQENTIPYTYPGDGKSYEVYVTNIAG